MLKYVNYEVVFAEIPNEITLAINISNCPCHCKGCHSDYLAEDIGKLLTQRRLQKLLKENEGITCVCFMGGDSEPHYINTLATQVKETTNLKVGWYSGREIVSPEIDPRWFDYIKLGPYKEEYGPLNNPNTNQRLYKIVEDSPGVYHWINITNKFWNENTGN